MKLVSTSLKMQHVATENCNKKYWRNQHTKVFRHKYVVNRYFLQFLERITKTWGLFPSDFFRDFLTVVIRFSEDLLHGLVWNVKKWYLVISVFYMQRQVVFNRRLLFETFYRTACNNCQLFFKMFFWSESFSLKKKIFRKIDNNVFNTMEQLSAIFLLALCSESFRTFLQKQFFLSPNCDVCNFCSSSWWIFVNHKRTCARNKLASVTISKMM